MDVVNGKIVETARVAGTEPMTTGGDRRAMPGHHRACSGLKPSRGFGADARPEGVLPLQQGRGNIARWPPSACAPTSMFVSADTTTTSPVQQHTLNGAALPSGLASAAPRWNHRPQELAPQRAGRAGHAGAAVLHFTGMQDHHREGWKWSGLRVKDVENGKVVEPVRDHPQALGLKPSRARVVDAGRGSSIHEPLPGCFVRAAAAEWASGSSWVGDEPMSPSWHSWSGAALVNGAPSSFVFAQAGCSVAGHDFPGSLQPPNAADHRQSWNRINAGSGTGLSSSRRGSDQQRHYHFDASPCSEGKLDEEMTMFESQLTRSISGHFSALKSVPPTLSRNISSQATEVSAPVVTDAGNDVASSPEKKSMEVVAGTSSVLKRKRSDLADGDVQGECGWIQPLKVLVRKGLTVSDVGELGRIIIPKKDAESQSFPQIDTKEGTVLEMEDYTASKRWYFRFKYWINNKSRMYVLENTGEFIKYHSMKEHDLFIVYEDGCKKLVVCGQKTNSSESSDPMLELSKSSTPETRPTSTEEESSRDERHSHHQHRSGSSAEPQMAGKPTGKSRSDLLAPQIA